VITPALYGKDHPYGLELTEAGVGKLTRDAIAKFHDTWYRPNNTTLVIVGDTTPAELNRNSKRLLRPGSKEYAEEEHFERSGAEAGRSVFDRQTGRGAVFYLGGNNRTARNSRRKCAGNLERRTGRDVRRARKHEPARGQALVFMALARRFSLRAATAPG